MAAVLAYGITYFGLIRSRYAVVYFLIKKSPWLYLYPGLFAFYACVLVWLCAIIPERALRQMFGTGGHIGSNPWVQAVLIGICITFFLTWDLLKSTSSEAGGSANPFKVIRPFERYLLRRIILDYNCEMLTYLQQYIDVHEHDLEALKDLIRQNIPRIEKYEKYDFIEELEATTYVPETLELYLKSFGRNNFELLLKKTRAS